MQTFRYLIFSVFFILCIQLSNAYSWIVSARFDGVHGDDSHLFKNFYTSEYYLSPPNAIRFYLKKGNENSGQYTFNLPSDLREGDELWIRIYLYVPQGFDWSCNPITKLVRIAISNSEGKSEGYCSILATKPINYGCNSGSPNKFGFMVIGEEMNSNQKPPPICQNKNSRDGGAFLETGMWHCIELYLRISFAKGITRSWHNGILRHEYFYPTIPLSGYVPREKTKNWTQHHLLGWWNGGPSRDQHIYFDNMIITNQRPSKTDLEGNYMIGPENTKKVQ